MTCGVCPSEKRGGGGGVAGSQPHRPRTDYSQTLYFALDLGKALLQETKSCVRLGSGDLLWVCLWLSLGQPWEQWSWTDLVKCLPLGLGGCCVLKGLEVASSAIVLFGLLISFCSSPKNLGRSLYHHL